MEVVTYRIGQQTESVPAKVDAATSPFRGVQEADDVEPAGAPEQLSAAVETRARTPRRGAGRQHDGKGARARVDRTPPPTGGNDDGGYSPAFDNLFSVERKSVLVVTRRKGDRGARHATASPLVQAARGRLGKRKNSLDSYGVTVSDSASEGDDSQAVTHTCLSCQTVEPANACGWLQCPGCLRWAHAACVSVIGDVMLCGRCTPPTAATVVEDNDVPLGGLQTGAKRRRVPKKTAVVPTSDTPMPQRQTRRCKCCLHAGGADADGKWVQCISCEGCVHDECCERRDGFELCLTCAQGQPTVGGRRRRS
eukprot:GHVU01212306.1.p1 GENE.GHVU01212306.1~~GHVU01212306.1.p1  ORF type:complete len:309 (-),score=23.45 GHVU01212306.1:780-1706(-)